MDIDSFLSLFDHITFYMPSLNALVAVSLAAVLLFCSGFVSSSEIAFFSLSPTDKSSLDEESVNDSRILSLLRDSERLLATILISNNFVNVTIIMLCNYFFAETVDFGGVPLLEFFVITVLLTFVLLLFGEIMPKIYASQHPLRFCRFAAPTIMLLRKMWHPLSSLLMRSSVVAGMLSDKTSHNLSADDLEQALQLTDKKEIQEESNILKGVIRFSDENVREVMTSRLDMVVLNIKDSFDKVLRCVVDNVYSRIPVCGNNIDDIKGVLYIKDLLPHLKKPTTFHWQSLVRNAFFVPETKMIDDLLRDFQSMKIHMAIVIDEFGGTSGVVTMEDVIEEIVGEINDEYDEESKTYSKLAEDTYVFEAKTLLSDFYKILRIDDDIFKDVEGDADTLAGLLLELKGDFPTLHEKIDYGHFHFEILELDSRRILKVKVVFSPVRQIP